MHFSPQSYNTTDLKTRSINKYSFRTRASLPRIENLCHCPCKVKERERRRVIISLLTARGQIDEGEYVELDEDGKTQEDGIHQQTKETQSSVQFPLIQMYTENLSEKERVNKEFLALHKHTRCLSSDCFRRTVRKTDANSNPTEKMRPLLFRWIWAEKWFRKYVRTFANRDCWQIILDKDCLCY